MTTTLVFLAGLSAGVIGCLLTGAVIVRRLRIPGRPPISAENAKLQMGDSASALLNADDPTRRRRFTSSPTETL